MATSAAQLIVAIAGAYAGAGLVFGALFVTRWVQRLDTAARGTPWTFRLLILPGVVVLWPVLLHRCVRERRGAR